jgi:hypothetical protein
MVPTSLVPGTTRPSDRKARTPENRSSGQATLGRLTSAGGKTWIHDGGPGLALRRSLTRVRRLPETLSPCQSD